MSGWFRCSECENGWPTRQGAQNCLAFCTIMNSLASGSNTARLIMKATGYGKATTKRVLTALVNRGDVTIGPVTLGFGKRAEQTFLLHPAIENHILAGFTEGARVKALVYKDLNAGF